jgi:PAS domain S-box-containing protein
MDHEGTVIGEWSTAVPWPQRTMRHAVSHNGREVASLEIVSSLRPLLLETSLVALLGLLLGGGLFAVLRLLPLKSMEESENALKEANDFLSSVMQSSTSAIIVMNLDGRVVMVNRKGCELTGRTEEELVGSAAISHFAPDSRNDVAEKLQLLHTDSRGSTEFDATIINASGDGIPIACGAAPFSKENRVAGFVISAEDITLRKEAEDRIRHLAYFDNLTGLPNRMLFHDRLACTLSYAARYSNLAAVIFIDLDNFKLVNDTLGHRVGDLLLQEVALRLQNCTRKTDVLCHYGDDPPQEMVARLGGDEFTILLTKIRQSEDAVRVVQRIFTAVNEPFRLDGHELYVTMSIGISIYPTDGTDMETLLRHADTAMYHAKSLGRNTYQFYRPSMNESAMARLQLESSLYRALEHEEFELYYQPQRTLRDNRITSMEALIRWNNPDLGMLYPEQFIPIAEETGIITPITDWVLQAACRQNRQWHERGFSDMRVSVNISAHLFKNDKLPGMVERALETAALPSRYLELEITESVMLHNMDHVTRQLQLLKAMGVFISIDDFGTGYSSFNYLKLLPIDSVKIDRSFIHDLLVSSENMAIIKAIIAAAHTLELTVVAEGMESPEQLTLLERHGCDQGQGHLVSRPVPAASATAFLQSLLADDTPATNPSPSAATP